MPTPLGTIVSTTPVITQSDTITALGTPTEAVDFNRQQILNVRIENRTSDPPEPAVGQIWLRTDL